MKFNSKRLRQGAALLAVSGAAAVVAIGPAAAFTGTAGSGNLPKSDAPDLVSAKIIRVSQTPSSGPAPQVQFCFDQAISALGVGGSAFVDAYDSASFTNTVAIGIDPNNQLCAIATFPNGQDIERTTVFGVGTDTVRDVAARQNPFGTVPLEGSKVARVAGSTEGPELVSATVDAPNNQVTYTFDENIGPAAPTATNFGFYNNQDNGSAGDTAVRNGASIASQGSNFAVVNFAPGSLLSAVAFFVKGQGNGANGTPRDVPLSAGPSHPAPIGLVGVNGAAPAISAPPLVVSATKQSGNLQIVDVKFDEAVTAAAADPTRIVAYRTDGTLLTAASVGTTNANGTLPVTFPVAAKDDPTSLVRIGFAPGAVNNQAGDRTVAYSSAAIDTDNTLPGLTDAPDLLSTTIDDNTNRATFVFDEALQDGTTPSGLNFLLLNKDGSTTAGNANGVTVSGDQTTATVQFSGSGSGAVGVALNPNAVTDDATGDINASVSGNVGLGLLNPQTGTASVTPTPTATTPPVVTPTPTATPPNGTKTKRVRSNIRGLKRLKNGLIRGQVRANNPCKAGRSVKLLKKGKKIATAKTSGSGAFKLKSKKAKKGALTVKVQRRVVLKGNVKTVCKAVSKKP